MRVAPPIDMNDFNKTDTSGESGPEENYEADTELPDGDKQKKPKAKKKTKTKKKSRDRSRRDSKWYGELIDFKTKREEIQPLLKDSVNRRASVIAADTVGKAPKCAIFID